jgi:hypothetical protein
VRGLTQHGFQFPLHLFWVVRRVVFALLIQEQGLLRDLLNRAELRPELRPDSVCLPQDLRAERLKRQGMGTPSDVGTTWSTTPPVSMGVRLSQGTLYAPLRSTATRRDHHGGARPTGPGTSRGPLQPAFTKAVARTARPSHYQDHSFFSDLDSERYAAAHPCCFSLFRRVGQVGQPDLMSGHLTLTGRDGAEKRHPTEGADPHTLSRSATRRSAMIARHAPAGQGRVTITAEPMRTWAKATANATGQSG